MYVYPFCPPAVCDRRWSSTAHRVLFALFFKLRSLYYPTVIELVYILRRSTHPEQRTRIHSRASNIIVVQSLKSQSCNWNYTYLGSLLLYLRGYNFTSRSPSWYAYLLLYSNTVVVVYVVVLLYRRTLVSPQSYSASNSRKLIAQCREQTVRTPHIRSTVYYCL